MNSKANQILKVQHANKPTAKAKPLSQIIQQPEEELVRPPEIELPEQPEPVGKLESLAEARRNESLYGSGWSLAQLMNEFGGR